MFRFASPYAFFLLILLAAGLWYGSKRHRMPALSSADTAPAAALPSSFMLRLAPLVQVLFYSALVLMIVALARPQWGTRQMIIDSEGINIILAVDLSESMAAVDFQHEGQMINRLDAIKEVVQGFVAGRSGDRIGMVVFGSQAYTQLPLTRDYTTITTMLERLSIGSAGRSTAIGDALGIALKRLADIESPSNVIILLTDGRSNSGEFEPLAAAAIAKQAGVKVYTIGVGGKGRAPFPIDDPVFGKRYVYQTVDLDEETLQGIADETGGLYFRATDLEGLRKIYETIDEMEKTTVKVKTYAEFNDLYGYLLLPAFVLLTGWVVLKNTRFLTIP
jgi:Ca-activated chloride channel family protein